jgi:beta-glucosidase-like glycosyl hydrolase
MYGGEVSRAEQPRFPSEGKRAALSGRTEHQFGIGIWKSLAVGERLVAPKYLGSSKKKFEIVLAKPKSTSSNINAGLLEDLLPSQRIFLRTAELSKEPATEETFAFVSQGTFPSPSARIAVRGGAIEYKEEIFFSPCIPDDPMLFDSRFSAPSTHRIAEPKVDGSPRFCGNSSCKQFSLLSVGSPDCLPKSSQRDNFSWNDGRRSLRSAGGQSDPALRGEDFEDETDIAEWSLEEKIGQLLLVGFRSTEQVKRLKPGGVVLFSWNMKDVEEARRLTAELRQLAHEQFRAPLFVAIDHEGGQVLRLRKGLTDFPDAAALGATGRPDLAFSVGKAMGHELRAIGANVNLAPVLDIGNARSFLQNRIWGERGRPVGEMTTAFIRGLQSARVMAVAKHFPGHGRSVVDAHFKLPVLRESRETLWNEDLEPFRRAVAAGVDAVMTAHVAIPAVDSVPASLSKRFIDGVLRRDIGFDGLVLTDDLEMGGVSDWGNPGDVAVKALRAGSDMILIVWSETTQRKVMRRIQRAVAQGELAEADIDRKLRRILRAKHKYLMDGSAAEQNPFWRQNLRTAESMQLVRRIAREALSWLAGDYPKLMRSFGDAWEEPWKIWVPTRSAAMEWKRFRGRDEVHVLPATTQPLRLAQTEREFEATLTGSTKVVVVTGPRSEMNEAAFQMVRRHLSAMQKGAYPGVVALWAHQGQTPVRITKPGPAFLRTGLVALHSSASSGIRALASLLRQGAAARTSSATRNGEEEVVASSKWQL